MAATCFVFSAALVAIGHSDGGGFPRSIAYWGGNLGKRVMGLVILIPAGLGLVVLKNQPQGNMLILSLMLLVWGLTLVLTFSAEPSVSAN